MHPQASERGRHRSFSSLSQFSFASWGKPAVLANKAVVPRTCWSLLLTANQMSLVSSCPQTKPDNIYLVDKKNIIANCQATIANRRRGHSKENAYQSTTIGFFLPCLLCSIFYSCFQWPIYILQKAKSPSLCCRFQTLPWCHLQICQCSASNS